MAVAMAGLGLITDSGAGFTLTNIKTRSSAPARLVQNSVCS